MLWYLLCNMIKFVVIIIKFDVDNTYDKLEWKIDKIDRIDMIEIGMIQLAM